MKNLDIVFNQPIENIAEFQKKYMSLMNNDGLDALI